jgi:hypothetical protein
VLLTALACADKSVIPVTLLSPTPTLTPTATVTPTPTVSAPVLFTLDADIRPPAARDAGAVVQGLGRHEQGESVTVIASDVTDCVGTADFVFDSWIGSDRAEGDNPAFVTMNADRTIVAVYAMRPGSRACAPTVTPTNTLAPNTATPTPTSTPTPTNTPAPVPTRIILTPFLPTFTVRTPIIGGFPTVIIAPSATPTPPRIVLPTFEIRQ